LHRHSATLVSWLAAGCLSSAAFAATTPAPNHTGFPKTVSGGGVVRFGKPLVVDLDSTNNSGAKEIVVGTCVNSNTADAACENRRLYVFDHAGNVRAGWPQSLPAEPASSPAAADLDGDGVLEIVVGSGSGVPGEGSGRVTAFRADGSVLWTFTPPGSPNGVYSTPALGDLDGDGKDDVVFGSFNSSVYALKGTTGQLLPGWPIFVRDTVWSSPALADLDGDGTLEVIIGADSHVEGPPIDTPNGGALWVFRANGTNFPGFPRFAPTAPDIVGFQSSPAVGDIDGDGCPEIVIGTGQSTSTAGKLLHAWHRDGTLVAGWPVTLGGHAAASPILANLDADAALEVVVTDDTAFLYAFKGNGTQIFKMKPKSFSGASAVVLSEPSAAQVGSDNPAILVGGVGFDVTLVSKTGVQISDDGSGGGKLTYTTNHPVSGAAVADLDANGNLQIVAASGASAGSEADLGVYVWNAGTAGALPWPQFHRNSRRRGAVPETGGGCALPSPAQSFFTLTPCRVADSRQPGNLTYGGPAYGPGEQRTITFTGVCNIPSTARAVSLNVTVTAGAAGGDLRIFPGGDGAPPSSSINWSVGQTRSNNAIVPLSFDGRGHLTVQADTVGQVDVILDVNGYFK
jgi:VCBS repeat protein/FG-GAP repeat protein